MSPGLETARESFIDRRSYDISHALRLWSGPVADSFDNLSPEAQELGQAIDQYKLSHRRRFITYEETLSVLKSLGYHR